MKVTPVDSTMHHWDATHGSVNSWSLGRMAGFEYGAINNQWSKCLSTRLPYLGLTCDYMSIKYCMLGFVFILTKLIGRTSDQKLVDWTKHFKSIVVAWAKYTNVGKSKVIL